MAPPIRDRGKLTRMEQAVRVLLQGLGEDVGREGLIDTPKRVAKALLDCTQGYHQDTSSTLGTALFHEPIVHQGGEGIVVVRDIDFASTSEETLLPFHGRCHVAYRPKGGAVLGLSKLARLTKQYAKRLQTQERLAAAIAQALQQSLECHGVAVVLQARHLSNNVPPEECTNACVSGVFATKASAELEELLALLDLEDLPSTSFVHMDRYGAHSALSRHVTSSACTASTGQAIDPGVPAPGTPDPSEKDTDGDSDDLPLDLAPCCCEEMEAAVQQLLVEVGENPQRPGLAGAARRYVMSLLASTSGYYMQQPACWLNLTPHGDPGAAALRAAPQSQQQQRQQSQGQLQQQQQQGRHCGQELGGDRNLLTSSSDVLTGSVAGAAHVGYEAQMRNCDRRGGDARGDTVGNGIALAGGPATAGGTMAVDGRVMASAGGAEDPSDYVRRGCSGAVEGQATVWCGSDRARTLPNAAADAVDVVRRSAAGCCAYTSCCWAQCNSKPAVAAAAVVRALPEAAAPLADGPLRGVISLRLPFASQCEHHMLPFYGSLVVAYFPGAAAAAVEGDMDAAATLPRAAVERAVLMYTQRLQVQERITHQVADAVEEMLRAAVVAARPSGTSAANGGDGDSCTPVPDKEGACASGKPQRPTPSVNGDAAGRSRTGPAGECGGEEGPAAAATASVGVMVVCDAAHMCMVARGVENHSGSTTTFAVRGMFATRPELRRAVLRLFREH